MKVELDKIRLGVSELTKTVYAYTPKTRGSAQKQVDVTKDFHTCKSILDGASGKNSDKTIFVCGHGDISVENALLEIDEDYVVAGNVSDQTIFDMLEALKYYVAKDKKCSWGIQDV